MKYSIKDRIANERPTVEITDDLILTVDNSFKKVLAMQEELTSDKYKSDAERMLGVLNSLLKKEDVKAIEKLDLPFNEFLVVVQTIIAAASGQSLDEISSRFQK